MNMHQRKIAETERSDRGRPERSEKRQRSAPEHVERVETKK